MVIRMTTINCDKKKFQQMLEFMTVGGLLPRVGFDIYKDGSIRCVQFDKNGATGAKIVASGVFTGFEVDLAEKESVAMDANKILEYLKTLKGDDALKIELSDVYITLMSGNKKIKTDRLDVNAIESYAEKTPFIMGDDFVATHKKGTIVPNTRCSIEASVLQEMVKDTKLVDQKQYKMSFEAPNVFRYGASGGSSKRGNDTIEALITDASVEGEKVDAMVKAAVPEIVNLFRGAVEIHLYSDGKDVFPVWFKMVDDWMKVGYYIPTIDESEEE